MVNNRLQVWQDLARMTDEIKDGTQKPLSNFVFRDELDEWRFHSEIRCLEMRAMLWKMTGQLAIMKKYMDR
jgi:hypothetical protein